MGQQDAQVQEQEKVVERVVYVEKPKRKIGRKILIGGVILVLGLGGCSVAMSGGGDGGASAGGDGSSVKTEQVADKAPKTYGLGQDVKVKGAVWNVSRAYDTTTLEDPYGLEPPRQGNFVVVDFKFTNTGKEAVTLDSMHLQLEDGKGRVSEVDTDSLMYVPPRKDVFLTQVNPGVTSAGRVIFTVAPDAQDFTILAADMDMFSGEENDARIDAGF